jgi:hypothetical protein
MEVLRSRIPAADLAGAVEDYDRIVADALGQGLESFVARSLETARPGPVELRRQVHGMRRGVIFRSRSCRN